MPSVCFVHDVPVDWAIVLFSLAFFGQQSWSTLVMILPTDLFPRRAVGVGRRARRLRRRDGRRRVQPGRRAACSTAASATAPSSPSPASLHVLAFAVICLAIPVVRQ